MIDRQWSSTETPMTMRQPDWVEIMSNEIIDLLNALYEGRLSVDEVAQQFRNRKWPRRRRPLPENYMEALAAEFDDPEVYVPESFDDVIAAYGQRKITLEELRVLSEAVADAQRAEDAG
jgi:hypothetical protein